MNDTTVRYASAVSRGRTAWNAASRSLWTLAELAATVETKYADKTLDKLAADIAGEDLSGKTLANYATTWRAYVTEDSDGRDTEHGNAFSVHEKFNTLEDRVVLVTSRHWSAREAADLVKSRKNPVPEGDPEGDPEGEGASVAEPVNELDKLRVKAAELEAKLMKIYARMAELEDAQNAGDGPAMADVSAALDQAGQAFIHTPRKGLPEHDASNPQTGCPDCLAAGLAPAVTEQAGSPRRARRNRRQPANA